MREHQPQTLRALLLVLLVCMSLVLVAACSQEDPRTMTQEVLLEGTDMATKAYTYDTGLPGKTIVVVGGIHGNETAGFQAAEVLNEDPWSLISEGVIHFIPSAHTQAIAADLRYPKETMDLNRAFLGEGDHQPTLDLAKAIRTWVVDKQPDFVIDHHESLDSYKNGRLGNTLILADAGENLFEGLVMVDLVNPLLDVDLPFIMESSPPVGSFNKTLSEEDGLLVVTIETNRKLPLEERVDQQLIIAKELIRHYSQGD